MASSTHAIDDHFATNGVAPSGLPSASKPVSAERRLQNRKAQKTYRDRRRARLRELEDKVARLDGVYPSQSDQSDGYPLLSATGNLVPLLGNPSPASSPRDWHPTGLNPSIMPSSDGDLSLVGLTTWLDPARPGGYSIQTSSNATQFADSFFPGQLPIANAHRESMLENPSSLMDTQSEKPRSQRDILIFRPGGKTVSAQPRQLRQRILALPQAARDELRDWAKNGNFSFVDTFHYLVEDGNGHGSPLTHLHQHPGATASYSPYRNVLHMARISYFAALFANFSSLGFDFALFLDENSKSPFHGGPLDGGADEANVPPSLRPISSQLSIPHVTSINALICTAGIMAVPSYSQSKDGIELQFAVNHLGHFSFVNLLIEKLIAGNATVVTYSSEAHTRANPTFLDDLTYDNGKDYEKWTAYSNSKLCSIAHAAGLAKRYGPQGLRAFSVDPGIIVTTALTRSVPQEDFIAMGWVDANGNLSSAIKTKTSAEGSSTGIIAAFDRSLSNDNGVFLADGNLTEDGLLPTAVEPGLVDKLWKISDELANKSL